MGLLANFEPMNAPKAMTFIEAVKFSYKNYANFNGRASRSEFWYWMLYCTVAAIGLAIVFPALYSIFFLSSIVPSLARVVRRLHDTGKPWLYVLFVLMPLVGGILLIVWYCTKSDGGANRFGPSALI